jgi:septal ring factor EnvC (AmiA/AmiB activator)
MWERNFTKWIGSRTSVVVHTVFFAVVFSLPFFGFKLDTVLLVLTTVVSLEAIYLAIFIQMTVNQNTESLEEVEEDIEDIVEDVEEISEDIGEIQQDVDEIQEDVDEIQKDVDEIQEDVDEIEKESDEGDSIVLNDRKKLDEIEGVLKKLLDEVQNIKKS